VHRLSGLDAHFLNAELPTQPINGMCLAIVRPPTVDGQARPLTIERLRAHLAERLPALPAFRWRLVPMPLELFRPVLVEDPQLDLAHHVREVALPAPGDRAALDGLCAREAARALDRSRPLWRILLINGLSDGRQAVLVKVHHCISDGRAALSIFAAVFDELDPTGSLDPITAPQPTPARWKLVGDAIFEYGRLLRRFPSFARGILRGISAANELRAKSGIRPPRGPKDTPECQLNRGSGSPHGYARIALSVDDVKTVARSARVTINDVVLGVVSEALRRYLATRDALPSRSLTATVFVGLDRPNAPMRQWGNQIASFATWLCTDVDDVWDRLGRIHRIATGAKRQFLVYSAAAPQEAIDLVPPRLELFLVGRDYRKRIRHRQRAETNVGVTSARGYAKRVTALMPVEEVYFSGPPVSTLGVNIAAWTYAGTLMITVACFRSSMDAPDEFVDALGASMQQLLDRARVEISSRARLRHPEGAASDQSAVEPRS
jgi:WS/DGAT/MGAT family acyltransferase